MSYSVPERETIGLCIALEALGDMVNHALLEIRDVSAYPGECEVWYKNSECQQIFLVRLLDFVKEGGDPDLTGIRGSCLDVLDAATKTASFDAGGSALGLTRAVNELRTWLDAETELKIWLPTLDVEAVLSVARQEFLFITANHVKHNLSRLTGVSRRVAQLLDRHGHKVDIELVPLALEEFRENLQESFFIYYGTWLAELLNDVRWGLQDYLMPAFRIAYTKEPGEEVMYRYEFPTSVVNPVPREWFWRLMNNVRSGPYLKRFRGAHYMKKEVMYS